MVYNIIFCFQYCVDIYLYYSPYVFLFTDSTYSMAIITGRTYKPIIFVCATVSCAKWTEFIRFIRDIIV